MDILKAEIMKKRKELEDSRVLVRIYISRFFWLCYILRLGQMFIPKCFLYRKTTRNTSRGVNYYGKRQKYARLKERMKSHRRM